MFKFNKIYIYLAAFVFVFASASASAASLSQSQISSIVSLLNAFGVKSEVVTSVKNILEGKDIKSVKEIVDNTPPNVKKEIKNEVEKVKAKYCPNIVRVLKRGSYGEDVKELQRMLKEQGYYKYRKITGYYGAVTERAVQEMQSKLGVVSYGSPESTGFGVVGPKTRSRILSWCYTPGPKPVPQPPNTVCTMEYSPVCGTPKVQCIETLSYPTKKQCITPKPRTYSNKCMLRAAGAKFLYSGKCKQEPAEENTISIESFTGPVLLKVGEQGVWKLVVSNKQNKPITYSISWGDESVYQQNDLSMNSKKVVVQQDAMFTHRYTKSGKYTIIVTVYAKGAKPETVKTTVKVIDGVQETEKLKVSPNKGNAPLKVRVDAQGIAHRYQDPKTGLIVDIADAGDRYIDFGDGSEQKVVCENPHSMNCGALMYHTYKIPGIYTIKLIEKGGYPGIDSNLSRVIAVATVRVFGDGYSVTNDKLIVTPTYATVPATVHVDAEALARSWTDPETGLRVAVADLGTRYIDFGDGVVQKLECSNPTSMKCRVQLTHTYKEPGQYTITLFVAGYYAPRNDDVWGTRSDVATETVTVYGM